MNDRKKLIIVIVALIAIIACSVAVYNSYKDRVDPNTGEITGSSQPLEGALAAIDLGNTKAPDFTFQDANGKEVNLSSFQGKPVVLNMWVSWCSHCKEEMPYFEAAYKEYGDQVQFIMLDIVKSEKAGDDGKTFAKSSGYTFPIYYETAGKATGLYGVRGFPATVFIDANGKIIEKNLGSITEDKLTKNIKSLLGK